MKDWREHPHLFANGKFGAKKDDKTGTIHSYAFGVEKYGVHVSKFDSFHKSWSIDDCQLIARPIEDMTDEECREVAGFPDMPIKKLREYLEAGKIADVRIPMLSIGVYPFDQSHFGDTVIDIRTLNE